MKKFVINFFRYTKSIFNKILYFFEVHPNVQTIETSLRHIITTQCSVSRFGDGEIELMIGNNIGFQNNDPKLATRLREVATSSCLNHYVAIPGVFKELHLFKDAPKLYWKSYLYDCSGLKNINRIFTNKVYLNAFISRFYEHLKDKTPTDLYVQLWKQIFKGRDLLIVEGDGSRLGVYNDLFNEAHSILRIICPAENAFSKYDEILTSCKRNGKDKLILIALGPTATILAFDLAKANYQALDVGHIDVEYEWYKIKAQDKIEIYGRYVNETNQRDIVDCKHIAYKKQIIDYIC